MQLFFSMIKLAHVAVVGGWFITDVANPCIYIKQIIRSRECGWGVGMDVGGGKGVGV